jgi:bifunctional non-homologous end joining protein LigD
LDQALPLDCSMRKANLDRLLRGRPDGIFINPFEMGAIGPDLFHAACTMGLEGMVSKRGDSRYRSGRSTAWIKVKNRAHPAFDCVKEAFRKSCPSIEKSVKPTANTTPQSG